MTNKRDEKPEVTFFNDRFPGGQLPKDMLEWANKQELDLSATDGCKAALPLLDRYALAREQVDDPAQLGEKSNEEIFEIADKQIDVERKQIRKEALKQIEELGLTIDGAHVRLAPQSAPAQLQSPDRY